MRGNASRFPDKRISAKAAEAQLAMLLSGATDERIAAMTVDGLATMFRVDRRVIECKLSAEQGRRARRG